MTGFVAPRKKQFTYPFQISYLYIGSDLFLEFTDKRLFIGFTKPNVSARYSVIVGIYRLLQKNGTIVYAYPCDTIAEYIIIGVKKNILHNYLQSN